MVAVCRSSPDVPTIAASSHTGCANRSLRGLHLDALTAIYCLHFTTFYFILKWVPKIVVDVGFPASAAASVLVGVNIGGAIGSATVGFFSRRFGLKALTLLTARGGLLDVATRPV